jgi:hypothetical protein
MSNSTSTSTQDDRGKLQKTSDSRNTPRTLHVKPLPQNRPVAENVSEGTDELMGYLD